MRTIESPGVEIREVDLSFNTELPNGTTSLVIGYAKQGPTDELLNVTSAEELEQIYGMPENAAERYMYQTARQILNVNGNLLVTRVPYGSGDGEGYTTKYSALIYPYIPVDMNSPCTTYGTTSGLYLSTEKFYTLVASETGLQVTTTNDFAVLSGTSGFNSAKLAVSAFTQFSYNGVISGTKVSISFPITGGIVAGLGVFAGSTTLSGAPITATNFYGELKAVTTYDENVLGPVYYALLSSSNVGVTFGAGILSGELRTCGINGSAITGASTSNATNFYLGEPTHITIDEDTYMQWLQGGIQWKSTVPTTLNTNMITAAGGVGYGAMIVVNELKSTIDERFAGYYVAIADNSKMDKGSNFDSIAKAKTFNQTSDNNEWMTLNPQSLAFSMTGSYYQHSGSVSEIVESLPDFDFANVGKGGFGDSIALAVFKVRPSVYNDNERVLDKVLYEAYLGSFDATRTIQNQAGGAPLNFFLEEKVNKVSNAMKVFVNPYISQFSGRWYDAQTQDPLKYVRVVCGERNVLGSFTTDVIGSSPAEPHGIAKVIFDKMTGASTYCAAGDGLYGVGEYVPCDSQIQKYIGNLPRKLEKALRLAENYEQLRLDLVPEAGIGTIWTGMNLDMSNWPTNAMSRTDSTRIKEIFDDKVYINGILNAHTFDKDSDGLLSQTNGSASEAGDLYESISSIFNQFCQYTRKDCLYIADPLRYIFVQGNGDMKVMDKKTLNFSQHIFWPLKNLFGGLNSSYACTYANWFKVNDTISDKFVWAPPSGFLANRMINTDTNFFPWYAPAGLTRGVLTGILDIGINPTHKQRDLLYKNGINPTVYWPGDGYVVWGQKTLQRKPSAFDRINVRRLFLWAEKAVLQLSRYFVFEQNTPSTRGRLRAAIDPVLSFAKRNEGIYDYMIISDEKNNTPDVIDRNELVVDIYIRPVRVAEFILINFVATRTGQKFEELI